MKTFDFLTKEKLFKLTDEKSKRQKSQILIEIKKEEFSTEEWKYLLEHQKSITYPITLNGVVKEKRERYTIKENILTTKIFNIYGILN